MSEGKSPYSFRLLPTLAWVGPTGTVFSVIVALRLDFMAHFRGSIPGQIIQLGIATSPVAWFAITSLSSLWLARENCAGTATRKPDVAGGCFVALGIFMIQCVLSLGVGLATWAYFD